MKTFAVFSQLLLLFLGVFLMIVVLLQRGRGGGLAGAFGGMGGQSAFGTKAGDMFTKITIVIAVAWVLVSGGSGYILRDASTSRARAGLPETAPITTDDDADNTPPAEPWSASPSGRAEEDSTPDVGTPVSPRGTTPAEAEIESGTDTTPPVAPANSSDAPDDSN